MHEKHPSGAQDLTSTVALLEQRLPSRVLEYLVGAHAIDRESLERNTITDRTIAALLQAFGTEIRSIIERDIESRRLCSQLPKGENPWNHVDPKMRGKDNPLVGPVCALLKSRGILKSPGGTQSQ